MPRPASGRIGPPRARPRHGDRQGRPGIGSARPLSTQRVKCPLAISGGSVTFVTTETFGGRRHVDPCDIDTVAVPALHPKVTRSAQCAARGPESSPVEEHMAEFFVDRRDIDFVLFEQLPLVKLADSERFSGQNTDLYAMVLNEAEKIATEVLAPINAEADREGCRLENGQVIVPKAYHKAYKLFCEGGWVALHTNPELGGQGLPATLFIATSDLFVSACTGFVFYPGLTVAAGHMLEKHAKADLVQRFVPNMYSGKWTGTMCLTEPNAGTAVGDLKSSAVLRDDGTYDITGTKIFISCGDHDLTENIIHLVLARVKGDAPGIKGVSLFIVPKIWVNEDGSLGQSNDVNVAGLEHKMGIHGCSTALLSFGDAGQCRGLLVGEQGKGIKVMFQMMNEARLITGLQGMSLGSASYQIALHYAKERIQGTSIANFKDVDAPRVPIIEHPDVRRMLLLQKSYVEGLRALIYRAGFLLDQAEATDDDDERERLEDVVGLLTPVCKAFGSDMGFRVTEWAMQTLGGYGYISEYGIEQHMRDCKIASIYEGTNGIQAMDLLGRKLTAKNGMVFMGFLQELSAFISAHKKHPQLGEAFNLLEQVKNRLGETTYTFATLAMKDPEPPMLYATPFLEMMGQMLVAWMLLEQATIADQKLSAGISRDSADGRFYAAKVATAVFFATNVLPQALATADIIKRLDRSALDITL